MARLAGWQPALETLESEEIEGERGLLAAIREDLLGGRVDGSFAGRLLVNADGAGLPAEGAAVSLRGAEVVLERLEATYRDVTMANVEPVVVRWELGDAAGTTEIVSLFLTERGRGSELIAAGEIGAAAQGYPLDLSFDGELPASWLELLGEEIEARGSFDFLGSVSGTLAQPELNGQAGVRGGELVLPGFPHTFEDVEIALLFFPDRVIVDSARSRCASGTVRVQGSVLWPREPPTPPAAPARPRIELQARVASVDLRYPQDWNLRGNAELSFRQSSTGERQMVGRVDLEQAVYGLGTDFGIGQLLRGFATPVRFEVARVDPLLDTIRLNVEIVGRDALRVRNNLADLRGRLDLIVQGTLGRPILFGTVELEPGGSLRYGGDEYQIAQGRLTFADPYETRPLIDLEASTRRRDYRVVLRLSGTRERLEANLSSDPPLPELEVLGLLAGGTGTPGSDAGLQPLGQEGGLAASELLYGTASTLVEERVQNLFGLDRFRINPLRSGDTLSSARVTVGKRLSKDLLVTYSTDSSTTEESVLEVEWQITDRLVLVLSQNADGTYSVDARVEQTL
jgi:translocation and assembly module TamB